MFRITPKTSTRQMLRFLEEEATKNEVTAICVFLQNNSGLDVPVYGTKQQLLCGLEGVGREHLADAFEAVFPQDEEEAEEEPDDWDQDEEEDEENEEDDEE